MLSMRWTALLLTSVWLAGSAAAEEKLKAEAVPGIAPTVYTGNVIVFDPRPGVAMRRVTNALPLKAGALPVELAATHVRVLDGAGMEVPSYSEAVAGHDNGTTIPHLLDEIAAEGQPPKSIERSCAAVYLEFDVAGLPFGKPTAYTVIVGEPRRAERLARKGYTEADLTPEWEVEPKDTRHLRFKKPMPAWGAQDPLPTAPFPAGTPVAWQTGAAAIDNSAGSTQQTGRYNVYYVRGGPQAGQVVAHSGLSPDLQATYVLMGVLGVVVPAGEVFTPGTTRIEGDITIESYTADDSKFNCRWHAPSPPSFQATPSNLPTRLASARSG